MSAPPRNESSIPSVISIDQPSQTHADARRSRDKSLLQGVAWNGIAKLVAQAGAWASTLVVARLLSPDDYGLVGMATFALGLVDLITEFGIGTAIAIRKEVTPRHAEELNTVSVLMGVGATGLMCLAASPLGSFFHDGRLAKVVIALSITFLIKSFRSVPWGLLQRDLRFKRLALYDAMQSLALAALSIVLARLGFGYWTLVAASIGSAVITSALAVIRHPVAFRWPNLPRLAPLLSFSGHLVGARAAWYAYSNSDFLVAGRMLGSDALGNYTLAWTLSHATDKITALVLQVTPAVLGKVQDELVEVRRYVSRITEAMSLTILPLMMGLALVAHDFVPLVLSPKWDAMIFPLQVLSAYAGLNVFVPLLAQVLNVTGHAAYNMRHNFLQVAVMPCAFIIGAHFGGVNGIVVAWVAAHPLLALRISRHTLRTIQLPVWTYVRDSLAPAVIGCAVMASAVMAIRFAWWTQTPTMLRMLAEIAGGAAAYMLVLVLAYRRRIVEIRIFATQMLKQRA